MLKNQIGVIYPLRKILDQGVGSLMELDITCVQINCWEQELYTRDNANRLKELLADKIKISGLWAGWSGPCKWDFVDGPGTLGLVPPAYRFSRIAQLKAAADFAVHLGVKDVTTHVGFINESSADPEYRGVLQAVGDVAEYCGAKGIHFNFETGQETPTTLMRAINDIGCDNLGINLDPANLIMYGKGNPVDALDTFKGRIRCVHVKDGDYPKGDFHQLGEERVVGEGRVNFPIFLPKLIAQGYLGDLIIEREIEGAQQSEDIRKTIVFLKELVF